MNTDNFNLVCIYDFCITISYVHAPNTVKGYSELRTAIPKSNERLLDIEFRLPLGAIFCGMLCPTWPRYRILARPSMEREAEDDDEAVAVIETWRELRWYTGWCSTYRKNFL